MSAPLRIRAHTAVCLQGYIGRGYSDGFVRAMDHMVEALKHDPEVVLIDETDGICGACPHGKTGGCRLHDRDNESQIANQDRAVRRALGIDAAAGMRWSGVVERIASRIAPDDLDTLCGDCPWLPMGMCKDALRRLHKA